MKGLTMIWYVCTDGIKEVKFTCIGAARRYLKQHRGWLGYVLRVSFVGESKVVAEIKN